MKLSVMTYVSSYTNFFIKKYWYKISDQEKYQQYKTKISKEEKIKIFESKCKKHIKTIQENIKK